MVLRLIIVVFLFMGISSCYKETPVTVSANFEIEVIDNDYSVPVVIRVSNRSVGADLYEWTFEGGKPEKSNKLNADDIIYDKPGVYTIRLAAWNSTERKVNDLTINLDSALNASFTYTTLINNYAPVEVVLTNHSYGGHQYYWEFGKGEPSYSEMKNPPTITFKEAGSYIVSLQVSSTREVIIYADTIHVLPALGDADFTWNPSENNQDVEVPFKATLSANCIGALSYRWSVDGGVVADDTLANTEVFFDKAGKYIVCLEVTNDKEIKRVTKDITVFENSNLYTIKKLKFGTIKALTSIGCFYSSKNRTVLTPSHLTLENGRYIDFVFWGLGSDLVRSCIISPDSSALKALPDVPNASHTWLINNPTIMTLNQFIQIEDDKLLYSLPIKANSDKNLNSYFTKDDLPHLVLFQTQDGRKGAMNIKEFISDGENSYVLADIKVQKEMR